MNFDLITFGLLLQHWATSPSPYPDRPNDLVGALATGAAIIVPAAMVLLCVVPLYVWVGVGLRLLLS